MRRESLERQQVWIYVACIMLGLALGMAVPSLASTPDWILWPILGLLLLTTFVQIPVSRVHRAFLDTRFTATLLTGNFLLIPALVWLLVKVLPEDPVIRVAAAAVLLVPCTDWFITFTQLGRGDGARAIAGSPLLLLGQILLLPLYLTILFDGAALAETLDRERLIAVFVGLIVVPLALATLLQRWAVGHRTRSDTLRSLGWLPVPLLGVVVCVVAATQVRVILEWAPALSMVAVVFVAYLLSVAILGSWLARLAALPLPAGRTLVFSMGTRNSFVILPLALAMPSAWEAAAVVIVLQTLVELLGMIAYLRWVPNRLLPDPDA